MPTSYFSLADDHTHVDPTNLDKFSLIGDFGFSMRYMNLQKLISTLNVESTIFRRGQDKAKPNPFEEITEKEQKLIENIVKVKTEELHQRLYKLREKQMKNKGISFDDFVSKYMSQAFIDPKDLTSHGLIDEIGYAEDHKTSHATGGNSDYELFIPRTDSTLLETNLIRQIRLQQLLTYRFLPS